MCVIVVVKDDKIRPTEKMLDKAAEYNSHGIGAAWREGKGEDKVVCWRKGIENEDLEAVKEMAKTLPVPYVLHFRAMSVGDVCKQLTHPFPIDMKASLALSGKTKGFVWFHNGTWDDWRKHVMEALVQGRGELKIPAGKWSDSRAIAWLSSIYGEWFAELLSDKQNGVVFGPNTYELYMGKNEWVKVEDIWCSNNDFMTKTRHKTGTTTSYYPGYQSAGGGYGRVMCKYGSCQRWDTDPSGYCPLHPGGTLKRDALIRTGEYTETKKDAEVVGTGGSRSESSSPFPKIPKGEIISLEMAEYLHHVKEARSGKRVISRGMIKEIKKQHSRLASADQKENLKGRKALERITEKLNNSESFLQNLKIFQPLSGHVN